MDDLRENPNWVGAAIWKTLAGDLRALPVGEYKPEWVGLLDVMDRDRDFEAKRPASDPEVAEAVDVLRTLSGPLLKHFQSELVRVYGAEARVASARLEAGPITGRRGPWATLTLRTPGDGNWIWVRLRNLWSPAPRLGVWYFADTDLWATARLRESHARIVEHGFDPVSKGTWRWERPDGRLARPCSDGELLDLAATPITTLVDARAFDVDIRRQNRDYELTPS